MHKNELVKAYAAWASVCLFWGTTYLAIRIGVGILPPALFAGIRFLIAGLIFIPFLLWRGYSLPARKDLVHVAIIGIALLAIANGAVVWAQQWVPSGLASLIVATVPFFMVGIDAALPKGEKLSLRKITGIAVGFSGLVLLLWPDLSASTDEAYLKGILGMFIAPVAWGAGSIYSKHHRVKTAPLMSAACQMLIAGVILTLIGAFNGEFSRLTYNPKAWAALGYLVVFGSIVGYSSYIFALAKLPTSIVSTYAYINPVIAVLLGWLVLDERLDSLVVVATIVILFGVVLVKMAAQKGTATTDALNDDQMEDIAGEENDLVLDTT